jgi:hypothetical protein
MKRIPWEPSASAAANHRSETPPTKKLAQAQYQSTDADAAKWDYA